LCTNKMDMEKVRWDAKGSLGVEAKNRKTFWQVTYWMRSECNILY